MNINKISIAVSTVFLMGGLAHSKSMSEYQISDLGLVSIWDNPNAPFISADGRVVVGAMTANISNHAFRLNDKDQKIIDLGSLTIDNSGFSKAFDLSANGRVVVGHAQTDNLVHAFRHNEGDQKMTDLGTLRSNNSGSSGALGVSADGRVVVGSAQADKGHHAFRHNEGDQKMTDLGTLTSNINGTSIAVGVSADGRVVAGDSDADDSFRHAFRHNEGDQKMTDLGSLGGDAYVKGISADGRVVIGYSETGDYHPLYQHAIQHAFRHDEGDQKMTALVSFTGDPNNSSDAYAVSADGHVVVGYSETGYINHSFLEQHAFRHNKGDQKMTDLGALTSNNRGDSYAVAVSADGRVVVGNSEIDNSDQWHAFYHSEGDKKMTDLGTLKSDNSGRSGATGVSADGSVIVGYAETDEGARHLALWKIKPPEPPIDPEVPNPPVDPKPPTVIIIDKNTSSLAMGQTGQKAYRVMDLYQNALFSLAGARCQIGGSDYCVGAFSQFNRVSGGHRTATGLFGALRLPSEHWLLGGSVNFANHTDLVDGYDTRGNHKPGLGLFIRYQQNQDDSGLNVALSTASLSQNISIKRERLSHTEAGKGNTRIKGYLFDLSTSYGINVSSETQLAPTLQLKHYKLSRDAYTEEENAEFPATYGALSNKVTELGLGLKANQRLSAAISVDADLGVNIRLNQKRQAFSGKIDYIGAYVSDRGDNARLRPYLGLGTNMALSKYSTVRIDGGWEKNAYNHNSTSLGLSYSHHW